jgi:hypothetical protein
MPIVVDKYINVLMDNPNNTDAGVLIKNGDTIDITVTGSVWSGVIFTGTNGPDGWPGWSASNDAVLPGAPPFSALLNTAEDGYHFLGSGVRETYQNATLGPGETELSFMINHDPVGRMGAGSFLYHLVVTR